MTKDAIRKRNARVEKAAKQIDDNAAQVAKVLAAPAPVAAPVVPVVAVPPVVADAPAAPIQKPVIAGLDSNRDILVTTGETWNARHGIIHPVISLADATFPFNGFEYELKPFPVSSFGILRCSDTAHEVGTPLRLSENGQAKSYYIFNNARLRKFLETLCAGIEKLGVKAVIKTAGTLKDRAWQFTSIELQGLDVLNAGGREIRSFLSLLKSFDKSIQFTLVNSTITVCCKNTFKMVHDDTGAPLYAKVKMTKNAELRIDEVPNIVEAFVSGNNALLAKLKQWHDIGINTTQAEQIFSAWLANPAEPLSVRMFNIIQRLKELHLKGKGNKGETALDAFNAVTEYYTHESAGETDNANKQWEASEIGGGAEAKEMFFDYLTKSLLDGDTLTGVCKIGDSILVAYNQARKA